VKGWLIFAGIFIVGVLLIISAIVYMVLTGGAEESNTPARVMGISGLILAFGAIYGSAYWRFRRWYRTRDQPDPNKRA
jgi:hypothetical protein